MAIPVDNRFPHLIRISDVRDDVRRVAEKAARPIVNRTNIGCLYNTKTGGLYFHLPHDIRCGLAIEFPIEDDGRLVRPSQSDIDDVVRLISMARNMSAAEKDKIAASNEQKEEWASNDATEKHLAERRPDALDYAKHLDHTRKFGKHSRKAAVVNGLKGA